MLIWTKEMPTKPGWYWHKPILDINFTPSLSGRITRIQERKGILYDDDLEPILRGSFWAGPIPEPINKDK